MTQRKKPEIYDVMGEGDDIVDLETMGDRPAETTEQDRFAAQVLGVFPRDDDFDRARSEANSELIQLLAQYLTDNPSIRFGQALHNLDLLSGAPMAEPQVQLARAKNAMRRR